MLRLTKILPVRTKDASRMRKGSRRTSMNIQYAVFPSLSFLNLNLNFKNLILFSKNVEVLLLSINIRLRRNLKRKTWVSGIIPEIWDSEDGSWTMIKEVKCWKKRRDSATGLAPGPVVDSYSLRWKFIGNQRGTFPSYVHYCNQLALYYIWTNAFQVRNSSNQDQEPCFHLYLRNWRVNRWSRGCIWSDESFIW